MLKNWGLGIWVQVTFPVPSPKSLVPSNLLHLNGHTSSIVGIASC